MTRRRSLAWILGLCIVVAVTNRYENPADPTFAGPGDSYAYLTLALSAPGLPQRVPADPLPYHHAQRLVIPYLLGAIHSVVPIPIHRLFLAAAVLIELAILLLFARMLNSAGVTGPQAAIALALLALNPWAFRPYLTYPEMVTDLGFVLGLAIVLRGLLTGGPATVLVGQFVASVSRQTGLLIVPMVMWWLWHDRKRWSRVAPSGRLTLALAVAALAGGVYTGTGYLAASFAGVDVNAVHIVGVVEWVATEFDLGVLAAFLARAMASPLLPLAFLLGIARRCQTLGSDAGVVPLLLFATVCIAAQPLLGGPAITGGNGPRLVTLGLLPLCLALAITFRDAGVFLDANGFRRLPWVVALLTLGSLHHFYVYTRLPSFGHKALFALTYIAACAGCFLITSIEARRRVDGTFPARAS